MRKQWKPPTPSKTTAILSFSLFFVAAKGGCGGGGGGVHAPEILLRLSSLFFRVLPFKSFVFPPFSVSQALLVNKALMKVELSQVLSTPHNEVSNPAERDEVGSYIYKKMAVAGLTVAMQHFSHRVKHIKRLVE